MKGHPFETVLGSGAKTRLGQNITNEPGQTGHPNFTLAQNAQSIPLFQASRNHISAFTASIAYQILSLYFTPPSRPSGLYHMVHTH